VTKHSGTEKDRLVYELSSPRRLSDEDFRRLSEIISSEYGIKMPDTKKIMLEARLRKRLKALEIESYTEYCQYLFSRKGLENELFHMIDVVTTNKTDFFRERVHFDYLVTNAVPELLVRFRTMGAKKLTLWSAGCSTGEEPYTIAMVLNDISAYQRNFQFEVFATDISTKVLQKAARGIYDEERVSAIPMKVRKKYFMRSKDKEKRLVRIVPELREAVRFKRLNFMDEDYGFSEMLDIIFCRNVFIYFSRSTQERLLRRFYDHLTPGGYLFMGHCETLSQMRVPFVSVGSMVYKKRL
jgi:chemotaxis protein methyltransferase CheR